MMMEHETIDASIKCFISSRHNLPRIYSSCIMRVAARYRKCCGRVTLLPAIIPSAEVHQHSRFEFCHTEHTAASCCSFRARFFSFLPFPWYITFSIVAVLVIVIPINTKLTQPSFLPSFFSPHHYFLQWQTSTDPVTNNHHHLCWLIQHYITFSNSKKVIVSRTQPRWAMATQQCWNNTNTCFSRSNSLIIHNKKALQIFRILTAPSLPQHPRCLVCPQPIFYSNRHLQLLKCPHPMKITCTTMTAWHLLLLPSISISTSLISKTPTSCCLMVVVAHTTMAVIATIDQQPLHLPWVPLAAIHPCIIIITTTTISLLWLEVLAIQQQRHRAQLLLLWVPLRQTAVSKILMKMILLPKQSKFNVLFICAAWY